MPAALAFQYQAAIQPAQAASTATPTATNSTWCIRWTSRRKRWRGAAACDALMRIQADALGVAVVRPPHGETTSLGAALAAGVGAGVWSAEAAFSVGAGAKPTVFARTADAATSEARFAKWKLAVERTYGLAALTDE